MLLRISEKHFQFHIFGWNPIIDSLKVTEDYMVEYPEIGFWLTSCPSHGQLYGAGKNMVHSLYNLMYNIY